MSRTRRLLIILVLNLVLVASLVIVGVTAHSLAVLAAGGDYLLDAVGVAVALLAIRMSAAARRRNQRSNASNVAALINAGWLLILELLVAVAAVSRIMHHSPEVHGLPVLIVSAIAALVMATGAFVLRAEGHQDGERDPSVAAVLLDTVADAAAATGVAAAGAIITVTRGLYWLDSAVALVIAVVIAWHALVLMRKVVVQLRLASAGGGG